MFRHQQNASMNGEGPSSAGGGLDSFYSYKNTFGPNSVWVDIPQQGTIPISSTDLMKLITLSHFRQHPESF